MSQQLLVPVTLRLDGEDAELIEKNGELLNELGFEIEPFGASEYALRALPADMEPGDAAAAVEEICEKMEIMAGDETLRTNMAAKAAEKIRHRYTTDTIVSEIEEYYMQLMRIHA